MPETELFSILDNVDSTNNYAMGAVHAGLAKHGMAWFARHQTAGKGQRGKTWQSEPGQNIALSIVLKPHSIFSANPFLLNALVSKVCHQFFSVKAGKDIFIKWPNDIYWRDRKAGGILIENVFASKTWKWAVVGMGFNINQQRFASSLKRATSLAIITGREYDPAVLAADLHQAILKAFESITVKKLLASVDYYNEMLYLRGKQVKLKKDNISFSTTIKEVNQYGQLVTEDAMERVFNFGEVEFL